MNFRKYIWHIVSIAIILAIISFSDITKVIKLLGNVDRPLMILGILTGLMTLPIWAYSWYKLLNSLDTRISYFKSLKLFTAGNFLNSVTPIGQFGGEPLMAYIIQKNSDLDYENAFSAVISADIINSIPILTFMIGGSIYALIFSSMNGLATEALFLSLMLLTVGGGLAYLLWYRFNLVGSAITGFIERIERLTGIEKNIAEITEGKIYKLENSFQKVREDPIELLKTSLVAHTFFIFQILSLYLVITAVTGLRPELTPLYFILPFSSVANFSPTPGGSGTYEALLAGLLTAFLGLSSGEAVTTAILYRFTTFWPGLLIGYISLSKLNHVREDIEKVVT